MWVFRYYARTLKLPSIQKKGGGAFESVFHRLPYRGIVSIQICNWKMAYGTLAPSIYFIFGGFGYEVSEAGALC